MTELRRDPIVGRWVIVNDTEPKRPEEFHVAPHHYDDATNCPFCYGNEHMTPPEISVIRHEKTPANSPGWQVRVVPNKFPALQIEGNLDRHALGMFDVTNGIGAHEVIVETPYHTKDLADLEPWEIQKVIEMYVHRSRDLQKDRRFKYLVIFKNYRSAAGATLDHNHSQLIALPMIPKNVQEELTGAREYYDFRDRCIFCDIIRQEYADKERICWEDERFIAFCPYVSRFPFETWILPKTHQMNFHEISVEETVSLAHVLKNVLARIKKVLNDPPYNFIIHTSPIDGEERVGYHWHLEIMPRVSRIAGFEWGTGFYVVQTPPEMASQYLKNVKI